MHNPNANPEHMTPGDFWCDFCRSPWDEHLAMVEGHQGSLICGKCLRVAYDEVGRTEDAGRAGAEGAGGKCLMCLEERPAPLWRSPVEESKAICRRCTRQSAGMLEKDPDSGWTRRA